MLVRVTGNGVAVVGPVGSLPDFAPGSAPAPPQRIAGVEVLADPVIPEDDAARGFRYEVPEGMPLFHPDAFTGEHLLEQVDQGGLGDCWAIAAMGAKALAKPGQISGMVADPLRDRDKVESIAAREPAVAGLLAPTDGDRAALRDYVLVDGPGGAKLVHRALPTFKGTPAYGGTNGEALWPGYLEKRLAATYGGGRYDGLDGDTVGTGFREIFGDADADQWMPTPSDVLGDIEHRIGAGESVVLGTGRTKSTPKDVFGFHSYVPLAARDGVLHLFNPWGTRHPVPLPGSDATELITQVNTEHGWYRTSRAGA